MTYLTKRFFVVLLLSFFIFAEVAQATVKFDSGSQSLANTWFKFKGDLPRTKFPTTYAEIKDFGGWAQNYGVGLAKIVGPGVAIAILSVFAGIIYGFFKLFRMCCCSKKSSEDEDEDEEYERDQFTWTQKWCPTICYFVAFVFLLTGMAFGLLNNPRFSQGIDDMGNSVISVGVKATELGNGLSSNVTSISQLVPTSIHNIQAQFAGVDPLADRVVQLSSDINATSSSVQSITTKVGSIDAGNTSAVSNLYNELASINNNSAIIISQMSELTYQIADKLHSAYNSTIGGLDSKVSEINSTVDDIKKTADEIVSQTTNIVHDVNKYVDDGKSYDQSRYKALMAVFVVVIVFTFLIVLGFIFKVKAIFNTVAAFGFIFLILLWLSGSIHFLLGLALSDACPIVDVAVQGALDDFEVSANGLVDPGYVIKGCLFEHRTVFQSLNVSAYNLSEVFDYKTQFREVANFSASYNFSTVDDYFTKIQNLYTYNLTAIANNITVASFNWTDQYVYDSLDALNQLTAPDVWSLSNYTQVNATKYGDRNVSVTQAESAVTLAINTNTTIYNKTATAKAQLISAQGDINALMANMTIFDARYSAIKDSIHQLETQNITNSIAILDNLQANITAMFDLGNCSFLEDTYVEVKGSLCETMQPSIDILTVAQFLAGLALIPIVILAEVLSFRIPKCKNLNPLDYYNDDDDDYDEEKAYKKSAVDMDVKYGNKRNPAISATISADPNNPNTNSATSSPDFGGRRKTIEQHFASHPHQEN